MPKLHYVKSAQKDNSVVKKGQPYWWAKFKTGPYTSLKKMWATRPRPSQMTMSVYWGPVYAVQEHFEDSTIGDLDDMQPLIDDLVQQVQEILDETQEKFDNMPEGLQQGDTGQTLEERIGNLEQVVSDLESINIPEDSDYDVDTDGEKEDWLESQIDDFRAEVENALANF